MKCPRTGSMLKTVKLGKIEVEISEQCAGIFFDNLELERFDEQHEIEGKVLIYPLSFKMQNSASREANSF